MSLFQAVRTYGFLELRAREDTRPAYISVGKMTFKRTGIQTQLVTMVAKGGNGPTGPTGPTSLVTVVVGSRHYFASLTLLLWFFNFASLTLLLWAGDYLLATM